MSETRDGGPAFPTTRNEYGDGKIMSVEHPGMSLRDWFAGQALAGFLAAVGPHQPHSIDPAGISAKRAYEFADAMLAARTPTS